MRFAERFLHGVGEDGSRDEIVIWIERRPGAVWAVGRAINLRNRPTPKPRGDDYLFDACAYVVLNPVRAGLCIRAEDWPWSFSRYGLAAA
jgi:hypothetical protein